MLCVVLLICTVSAQYPPGSAERAGKAGSVGSDIPQSGEQGDEEEEEVLNTLAAKGKKKLLEDVVYGLREDATRDAAEMLVRKNLVKQIYIGGCPRNYTRECPLTWTKTTSGCSPPAEYEGTCGAMDLSGANAETKEDIALRCKVQWACMTAPTLNFSSCPVGWKKSDEICTAPPDYSGICGPLLNMTSFTDDMHKARIAAFCHFSWSPALS